MKDDPSLETRLEELTERITQLEQTLRRSIEATASLHIGALVEGTRTSMLSSVINHVQGDNSLELTEFMPPSCENYGKCKGTFEQILRESMEELAASDADEDTVSARRDMLQNLEQSAPTTHCGECFSKALDLYEKQVRLMRSMRVYKAPEQKKGEIADIPAEAFVRSTLEPVANKARLRMLQSVAQGTMTFSAFSELTTLRGGNLLFHINKLIDAEMIIQRHERGDYMITEKGYRTLLAISDLASP